ncbi:MAG: TRAP transporter substrate-binding protein [Rhizomicrobium sp.]
MMFNYRRHRRHAWLGVFAAIIAVVLAACSSSSSGSGGSGSAASGPKRTIIGSCPVPQNTAQCAVLEDTAKYATALSKGQLQFQLHYDGTMGTPAQVQTLIQQGQVQLAVTSTSDLTALYGPLDLFNLPFLFPNYAAVHKITSGPAGAKLIAGLESASHIKLLAWEDEGFSDLLSKSAFVTSISQLKGQKIRVIEDPLLTNTYSSLGAIPVPTTAAEVYTGYETGEFSAAPFSPSIILANKWQEVAKYLTVVSAGMGYTENTLVTGSSFLSSLPKNLATDLQKAADEAEVKANAANDASETQAVSQLKADGVQFLTMSSGSVAAWKKVAVASVYPIFTKKYGSSILDAAQASLSS